MNVPENASPVRVLCIDHEGGHGGSSISLSELIWGLHAYNSLRLTVWFKKDGNVRDTYHNMGVTHQHVPQILTLSTVHKLSRNLAAFLVFFYRAVTNLPSIVRLAREGHRNFDVIHFNHPNLWAFAFIFWLFGKTPFSFHIRVGLTNLSETPSENAVNKWLNAVTSNFFAALQVKVIGLITKKVFFVSEWEQMQFMRYSRQSDGIVIFNCVSLKKIPQIETAGADFVPTRRVAIVENYKWSRGTDRLIEIARYFERQRVKDVTFHIAGDMIIPKLVAARYLPFGDSVSLPFEELVLNLGLERYFQFYGHLKNPERVITNCDLLLSLTRRAGPWGRSVIEAMSMGRPVLACGELPGFVESGKNGIFFEKYDPNAIGSTIIKLVSSPDQLRALSENARSYALKKFSEGKAERAVEQVWRELGTHG
jgi:glycosyltransferase involved in cell wall biosynthesis